MNSSSESVVINIGGIEYSIKTDIDIELTLKIAEYVDQKVMEMKNNNSIRDDIKIAVLTALNIAGELFEYKSKWEQVQKKLDRIQNKISSLT
ncbi:MAG: cell division protein ZapA [Chitinispirillia bacterium]|jgi:cell division protein ZapA